MSSERRRGHADLGAARPHVEATLVRRSVDAAKRALRGVERRVGLAEVRGQWMRTRARWSERRGDYCLMALLEKR